MTCSYAVVIEKSRTGYSAYVPDLPGCVATGRSVKDVERLIGEGMDFHIEGMIEDGDSIPEPTTLVEMVEVRVPAPAGK